MLSILVIVVSGLFIVITANSLRRGILFFLFMIPFSPRYMAIGFGGENLPLSLRRIMIAVLAVAIIWALIGGSKRAWSALGNAKCVYLFLSFVLALYLVKFIATLENTGLSNLAYFTEDFITVGIAIFAVLYMLTYEDGIYALLKIITLSLLVTIGLALFEKLLGHPLLQGIAKIDVYVRLRNPLAGRYRSGSYRVQAGFDNALLLSQYLSIVIWPCVVFSWKYFKKNLLWILVPLIIVVLLFTGARSGIVVPLAVIVICFLVLFGKRLSQETRAAFWLFLIVVAPVAGYLVYAEILLPSFTSMNLTSTQAGRSAYERIMQYASVWQLFKEKPMLGYGIRQIYSTELQGLRSLDNYYLALVLQGGVIALALALLLKIYSVFKMIYVVIRSHFSWLFVGLLGGLLGSVFYELFTALPANHIYFYLFATIGLALWGIEKNKNPNYGLTSG